MSTISTHSRTVKHLTSYLNLSKLFTKSVIPPNVYFLSLVSNIYCVDCKIFSSLRQLSLDKIDGDA